METITVHIDDNSPEVLDALDNAVQRWAMAVGEKASTYAKYNITRQGAVDTLRLRDSITYEVVNE